MKFKLNKFLYEANADGGSSAGGAGDNNASNDNSNQGAPVTVESFDAWYTAQSEDIKKAATPLKEHFDRMQNTVKDTRKERDDLSKQFRDAAKKLEAGSEAQKDMEKLASSLDNANRRANFYEEASSHECNNNKAAYAIAVASDLFKRDGSPDWKAIQAEAPQLFGKSTVTTKKTAGAGTNQNAPKTASINDWIRGQAGVQVEE